MKWVGSQANVFDSQVQQVNSMKQLLLIQDRTSDRGQVVDYRFKASAGNRYLYAE